MSIGIIFTGAEGPDAGKVKTIVEQASALAGCKPLFIAADSGLRLAEDSGFFPDYIIGDMDSVDKTRLSAYGTKSIIVPEHDQDYTDTELAFSFLLEKNCQRIWILGGGGGRVDHLFAIVCLFEREIPPLRWITAAEDIWCLDSVIAPVFEFPHTNLKRKNKPVEPVSVFPLGAGHWRAESEGLRWPLKGFPWKRGAFSLSNEALEGSFNIRAIQGRFMVIMPLE